MADDIQLNAATTAGDKTRAIQKGGAAGPKSPAGVIDQGGAGAESFVDLTHPLRVVLVDSGGNVIATLPVSLASLPALPAGTNNIGDVDVLTLPALPAGSNTIGNVGLTGTVPLPAGAATEVTLGSLNTTAGLLLQEGIDITGAAMPAGGSHARGWLSAIWKALTDRLPAALGGAGGLKTQRVDSWAAAAANTASADNAAAVLTYASAGGGVSHILEGVAWSFKGDPAAPVELKIEDGATKVFSEWITKGGAGFFPLGRQKFSAATALVITLGASGTAGVLGTVNAVGKTTE